MRSSEDAFVTQPLTRRAFLRGMIAGLGSVIALVLGGSGLGYILAPGFQKKEEDWVDLGPVAGIPLGRPVHLEFVQRRRDAWMTTERRSSAWVFTSDGKEFAVFDPRCTHLGCPYRWDDQQRRFLCPCHAAVFDLTGQVVTGPPPRPLDRYPYRVAGGRLSILPRRAHT